MTTSPDLNLVQDCFNQAWDIYQQILSADYMEHSKIYKKLHEYIKHTYPDGFTMLELGCGDAICSTQMLQDTSISYYMGVDISSTGLQQAGKHLDSLGCIYELQQQEMQGFLQDCTSTFDVILISFALHHLSPEQKQLVLQQCWQCLKPNGTLLLVDVFCQEGESRQDYLARYRDYIRGEWRELTSDSFVIVTDHMYASDFPEAEATLHQWGLSIGFDKVNRLYSGWGEVHKVFALAKH